MTDGEAIWFGNLVNVVRRNQAAGAGHVFDDDRRLARNMFAHMPGDGAGVCIKSSACGKPDNDSDGFAFVKVFRGARPVGPKTIRSTAAVNKQQSCHIAVSFCSLDLPARSAAYLSAGELPEAN